MQGSDNRVLAERFVASLTGGDIEGLLSQLSDDFSFEVTLPDNHPYYELRKGSSKDAFRRWLDVHIEDCDFKTLEVHDLLVSEDRVAVFGFEDYAFRESGKSAAVNFVWIFEVRGGKLVSLLDLFDTEYVGRCYASSTKSQESA